MNKIPYVRLACLGVSVTLSAISTAASAGFLDDFYDNSNYQGNLTKPGVIQSNTLNTITGGGFVYKTPRAQFNPFYFTPPSLKAGCGGIDIFAGAISIPSQAEFLAFLRNIGASLPGLAFELALQSLSPELAQQVAEYKNMLMKLAQNSTDACQAASDLLKFTGADQKIKEVVHDAENYGRSTGLFGDQAEAKKQVATNGKKAIDTVPVKYNADGEVVDAPEVNIVWSMLNNTKMAVSTPKELKELMMSAVGTWLYRKNGAGETQVLSPEYKEPLMLDFTAYIGQAKVKTLDPALVKLYSCDNAAECMNPTVGGMPDTSFAYRVYQAALNYRTAIVTRDPMKINYDELYMIASSSSIPLLRIVNATAYTRYGGFSEDIIAVFSEAVAYEMFLNYVEQLAIDIERAISTAQTNTSSALTAKHAKELKERINYLRQLAVDKSSGVYNKMAAAASFIQQVEHIEKSLRGNLAADLAANMAFSARR